MRCWEGVRAVFLDAMQRGIAAAGWLLGFLAALGAGIGIVSGISFLFAWAFVDKEEKEEKP